MRRGLPVLRAFRRGCRSWQRCSLLPSCRRRCDRARAAARLRPACALGALAPRRWPHGHAGITTCDGHRHGQAPPRPSRDGTRRALPTALEHHHGLDHGTATHRRDHDRGALAPSRPRWRTCRAAGPPSTPRRATAPRRSRSASCSSSSRRPPARQRTTPRSRRRTRSPSRRPAQHAPTPRNGTTPPSRASEHTTRHGRHAAPPRHRQPAQHRRRARPDRRSTVSATRRAEPRPRTARAAPPPVTRRQSPHPSPATAAPSPSRRRPLTRTCSRRCRPQQPLAAVARRAGDARRPRARRARRHGLRGLDRTPRPRLTCGTVGPAW